ncbi:MAG: hypothetical protein PVSMB4_01970 [Ktedonobacterales bacterium]
MCATEASASGLDALATSRGSLYSVYAVPAAESFRPRQQPDRRQDTWDPILTRLPRDRAINHPRKARATPSTGRATRPRQAMDRRAARATRPRQATRPLLAIRLRLAMHHREPPGIHPRQGIMLRAFHRNRNLTPPPLARAAFYKNSST